MVVNLDYRMWLTCMLSVILFIHSVCCDCNCSEFGTSRHVFLRNVTDCRISEYSRCLYKATSLQSVIMEYFQVPLETMIDILPENRSTEVRELNIQANVIPVIAEKSFTKFSKIKTIHLEHNHIEALSERAFYNLTEIETINLGNNFIVELNSSVFCNLPNLKTLFLFDNRLKYIADDAFVAVLRLSKINMDNNKLMEIPYESFSEFISVIKEITLSNNRISEISDDISKFKSLGMLYVDNNCLVNVSRNIAKLADLSYLHLNNNSLKTIPEEMLPIVDKTAGIEYGLQLGDNHWHCDCSLYWLVWWVQTHGTTDIAGQLVCNQPKQVNMSEVHLSSLHCKTPEQKDYPIGQVLAVMSVIVVAVTAFVATRLCRRRACNNGNHSRNLNMILNGNYYRGQSVVNSSGLVPTNDHSSINSSTSGDCDEELQLYVGFTETKVYGELRIGQLLGRGAFGDVFEGSASGFNNSWGKVAVKMIKDNATHEDTESLIREYQSLVGIGEHNNIIQVFGTGLYHGSRIMVMEMAKHGDLQVYVRNLEKDYHVVIHNLDSSEETSFLLAKFPRLFMFMWHVAKGMAYLTQMKIVHRDLAARNILIAEGPIAKISDFGLSRDVYESGYYFQETKGRLPYKWMSPETLSSGKYTTKSDAWSYGVFMWEVVTLGSNPYPGIPPDMLMNMYRSGYSMPQPPLCPHNIYSIMKQCWKHTPEHRPVFKTLVTDLDTIIQRSSKQQYTELFRERDPGTVCNEIGPDLLDDDI